MAPADRSLQMALAWPMPVPGLGLVRMCLRCLGCGEGPEVAFCLASELEHKPVLTPDTQVPALGDGLEEDLLGPSRLFAWPLSMPAPSLEF